MKLENKAIVINGKKICRWAGIITIVAAVILFIFDWLNGQVEWGYALTAAAFGLMCLYASKLLSINNEK